MKAWLITWVWGGEHAAVEDPIVAILSARMSGEQVRRYVDFYYTSRKSALREKLDLARYYKPAQPNYPAEFVRIGPQQIQWPGHITCGHNPWLYARKVDNLKFVENEDGQEVLGWQELSFPSLNFLT
jgi:hypothetical protein